MTAFRDRYLSERVNEPLRILDVGSQDVNGSYRQIFSEPRWSYTGLDMTAGPNVDIVVRTRYVWTEWPADRLTSWFPARRSSTSSISGSRCWEIARVLKTGRHTASHPRAVERARGIAYPP
jgi:hypothetical protein